MKNFNLIYWTNFVPGLQEWTVLIHANRNIHSQHDQDFRIV